MGDREGGLGLGASSVGLRLIGMAESKKVLEGRIRHMMTRAKPRTARVGLWGLAALFVTGMVLLPMTRGQGPSEPNTSEREQEENASGKQVSGGRHRISASPLTDLEDMSFLEAHPPGTPLGNLFLFGGGDAFARRHGSDSVPRLFDPADGVEQVVVQGGGQGEIGGEVVDELRASDGLVVFAIAAEVEALVVVPCSEGLGFVGAFVAFVSFALECEGWSCLSNQSMALRNRCGFSSNCCRKRAMMSGAAS